LKLKSLP